MKPLISCKQFDDQDAAILYGKGVTAEEAIQVSTLKSGFVVSVLSPTQFLAPPHIAP